MHIGAAARGALSKLWTRPPQRIGRRARWQTPWWGTMARWGLSKVTQRSSVDAHRQEAATPWGEVLALKPVGTRRTAVARRVKARRATGRVAHELWRWACGWHIRRARGSHSSLPNHRLLWRWGAGHGLRRTCRTLDLWAATGCGCRSQGLAHDQRAATCRQMQHLRAGWRHYAQVGFAGG
jgi:hypothetical protein